MVADMEVHMLADKVAHMVADIAGDKIKVDVCMKTKLMYNEVY